MARITRSKAAEILGVSRQTISNYIEQGLIGSYKDHSIVYVNSEDIEKYAQKYKMLAVNEKIIDDKLKELKERKNAINIELAEMRNAATAKGQLSANAIGMLFVAIDAISYLDIAPHISTGMTDEFELSGSVDNLRLKCKLKDGVNKDAYCSITLNLHKTNESLALFTGDVWMPKLYFGSTDRKSWQQWRMQVTSNNSSLYYLHHNTYGIMKQYGLYSIQRQYKNKYKFLYSHFSDNDDHKIVVFSWDGEFIRNNKNIPN